jgi:DNA-binding transcriptional MerR regulator
MLAMGRTYSTAQAAAKIGVSRQTLYTWADAGLIDAPTPIIAGNQSIRVWTERQVAAAKKFKGTLKPGPKSKTRKEGAR